MKRLVLAAVFSVPLTFACSAQAAPGDIYTFDPVSKPGSVPRILSVNPVTGAQAPVSSAGLLEPAAGYGVAYEPRGTLVMANGNNNNVLRIDKSTGAQTELTPGVAGARGVVVDTNGDIYATAGGTQTVYKIDPNTGDKTPLHSGSPLTGLRGIAIGTDGLLYLVENTKVFSMPKSGGSPTPVTSNGFLANAQDIVGLPDGFLYVSDFAAGAVIRIAPNGTQTGVFQGPPFDTLNAVGADANGKLLISDQAAFGSSAIFRFDGTVTTVSSGNMLEDARGMTAEPNAPATPTVPTPDKKISATITAKKSLKLKKTITVDVTCAGEVCTASASGNVNVPKTSKSFKLKKVTAKLKVTATDTAKNSSSKTLRIKLKR